MRKAMMQTTFRRRTALVGAGASGVAALLQVATTKGAAAHEGTPCPDGEATANKELVRRFYEAFYEARNTGDFSLIDEFVAEDYIQHEVGVEPGREGLIAQLQVMSARGPATAPLVEHLVAEGDIVVAHQVVPGADPAGQPAAEGVDIFRVADGQLVEHWGFDVSYDAPSETGAAGTPTG
jgi:predicted SnoaL-like aldol condensation-catalyzing enzyme